MPSSVGKGLQGRRNQVRDALGSGLCLRVHGDVAEAKRK